jgi:transposase-like protein
MREWRASGLSVRAFCDRHGLDESRFYAWRRLLQQRDGEATSFVPVLVVPDEPPATTGSLEVVLASGRSIRVAAGFDAATLQRLLAVLEEQPC